MGRGGALGLDAHCLFLPWLYKSSYGLRIRIEWFPSLNDDWGAVRRGRNRLPPSENRADRGGGHSDFFHFGLPLVLFFWFMVILFRD